ncbi:hypothetical protein YH66_02030 [[Brevibacterium] flavum]|uniref:Uncharacterized protein n=1 Tax=[Brevibacterium] flavum TaxID=92706 RepID=A0A0F6Z4W5_9CORY|nr:MULTISPECIES: hypothetical protein [Corynebacterium]AKF26416.1 hypothetical protein YH66_02030 [[Brevibacterium] flavum]AST19650.1 hypothetical protein CEY17_02040 [Corynebacterium glutamicum ATCC 14067]KEI22104.1 hypothetical protein KIQ_005820 [Corynebacterium glutamicum ATCC 14067]KIH74735.1 hypothetical protein SD36_02115 [Corynebacterium glutamicum]OKX90117.1 hypothetical protein AUP71_14615 [Corynebacterium glutamicum]
MTSNDTSWKTRYYELESTLEQVLLGFEKVLSEIESNKSVSQQQNLQIYKLDRIKFNKLDAVCCIANGVNIKYQFEFFIDNKLIHQVPFQRSNTSVIPTDKKTATRCKVTAKSCASQESQIVEREIAL